MYHPDLFKQYWRGAADVDLIVWTDSVPATYVTIWSAAVLAEHQVSIDSKTTEGAEEVKREMIRLNLKNVKIEPQCHKGGNKSYNTKGEFDVQKLTDLNMEYIKALNRKVLRIEKYGSEPDLQIAYQLLDELHTKIQAALIDKQSHLVIDNPIDNRFDVSFPPKLAETFKRLVTSLNPHIKYKVVEVFCYPCDEEGILMWNWDNKCPDLKSSELGSWLSRVIEKDNQYITADPIISSESS